MIKHKDSKNLRLIFPQWQGGDITSWFADLDKKEAAQGYILGAQILSLLVDSISQSTNTAVVEIDTKFMLDDMGGRIVEDGIIDKSILLQQTKAAFDILNERKPARILTLGGECAVSVPSFCYLANLYAGDVAMLWLDAHPDIGLPDDEFYKGYHAMAVSAIIGRGELKETFALPASLDSKKVLLVGLHSKEAEHYAKRQKEFGLASLDSSEAEAPKNPRMA
ncbi:arginase family protein [Helicobacter aurati]|uniref:Arginase family protein n=1 Tax=Helicobacter aurati TaxID=137778 RepID=A0A3D8J5J3_9HELI|nr:arginase family protein [Helicobacter aurati]RDU72762.1 arginase family protein [Helicobacter aurati]